MLKCNIGSQTFSDYFELNNAPDEIANFFGYAFTVAHLRIAPEQVDVTPLEKILEANLSHVRLTTEIAKREFLIAPILQTLLAHVEMTISPEYPVEVDQSLRGSLDYLLTTSSQIIIIEAKKGDIEKGFNQLVAQMIAVDKLEAGSSALFGAVSTGSAWRFAALHQQSITMDIATYGLPNDLSTIFGILLAILKRE